MRAAFPLLALILLLAGCGTETSGGPNLDEIRDRLNTNACRINRDELVFQMQELEFIEDTLFTGIPAELFPDSLLVCPVTGEPYTLEGTGDDRSIHCPSGHGSTEL